MRKRLNFGQSFPREGVAGGVDLGGFGGLAGKAGRMLRMIVSRRLIVAENLRGLWLPSHNLDLVVGEGAKYSGFCTPHTRFIFQLVFPNSEHGPASSAQLPVVRSGQNNVALNFALPIGMVSFRKWALA